jgi:tetratricopeptide (TPR) repeat protein
VGTTLNKLAIVYRAQGRYDEALKAYGRALAIDEKALGPEHPDVASTLNNLGLVYWNQGRYDEALKAYGRALAIKEKALGPEHPSVATTLNNLAIVYRAQGRTEEALKAFGRALTIKEKAMSASASSSEPGSAASGTISKRMLGGARRPGRAQSLFVASNHGSHTTIARLGTGTWGQTGSLASEA